MDLPQEIELWHMIPMIRKLLVMEFKSQELKQKEIASLLGLTESAVSQYIKDKRAKNYNISISPEVKDAIKKSAANILSSKGDERTVIHEINSLSNIFKSERIICKIHMEKDKNIKDCNVCYE